ncbi:MAG: MBL fold metallo-hydrolase [Nitrososphaeraceae archaeon]|nr:MBL fold metallo-hydrolase [Nitrososphaeraceae archaeon]
MNPIKEIRLSTSTYESPELNTGLIFFIGNATVLIRYAGFTVLTDPTFIHMHEKVHIGYGLTATRLTNPAVDIKELPPLDLVVLSHFHGDHFDQVAVRDLDKSLPIVTTPHATEELSLRGFNKPENLETWESISFVKGNIRLNITATPGRHGPLPVAIFLPQVMGSILDFETMNDRHLVRLYITGDTLVFDEIKEIPKQYQDIDIALLHLGGTTVMGIMVTMDAKEGIEMFKIINPKNAIPIHYNDYDVFQSPLEDFKRRVREEGLEERVHYLTHGETFAFEADRN